MSDVLVFGAGFLGTILAASLPGAEIAAVDITDRAAVRSVLASRRPRAIVNAAGKTGRPNVDWCEHNRTATYAANVVGPLVVAEEAERASAYLLHLGTGCIFYGPSPSPGGWRESDAANPIAYYSRCKYAADLALAPLPHVGIVRPRMPIHGAPSPRNLITKLAGYRQVVDVENSVTVVDDLVHVVRELVARRAAGVFHATNPGTMRHRDLLALYRELVDPSCPAELIDEEELVARGLADERRSNCVLADTRLAELGIRMRPIDEALRSAMERYAATRRGA